jgi:hypothetical protein
VLGNGQEIASGDTTPSLADDTDFGSLGLGQAITHTFTISNSGSAPLNLTGAPLVALSGPTAADFSLVAAPSTPVGVGQATTFQLRFSPSAVGTRAATVTIASDDSDEKSYSFVVQGKGTNSPPIANAGVDQVVGIGVPVTLDGSGSSDPDGHVPLTYDWLQIGGPPVSLSSRASATPTFTAPAASAVLSFSLTVTDSFGLAAVVPDTVIITVTASPPDIAVLGSGQLIADGDTTPRAADQTDFGSLSVGQAITHTFTISNSGGVDLHLSGRPLVAISGPNAADFSVVADPSTPVGAGQTTTFQVRFRPSAAGARLATITIFNDDGDENSYSFAVQGTGSAVVPTSRVYLPVVFSAVANLPDLTVESVSASSSGVTVVLKNVGTAPVAGAFWVDVYFDPSAPPSYNQTWKQIAPAGAVWGVIATGTAEIAPGATLTLTSGGAYYFADESSPLPFPAGGQVYAQVDSVNLATTYGAVRESDETNNVFGPVVSAPGSQVRPAAEAAAPVRTGLPKR